MITPFLAIFCHWERAKKHQRWQFQMTPEVPGHYVGEAEPGRGVGLPWQCATRVGCQRAGPARLQGPNH